MRLFSLSDMNVWFDIEKVVAVSQNSEGLGRVYLLGQTLPLCLDDTIRLIRVLKDISPD